MSFQAHSIEIFQHIVYVFY